MLFDLKGKRRRAIQVTYAALAVLMAGGLILFGIGGGVGGGLLNAVSGSSAGGNSALQGRIDQDNRALAQNPGDQMALADLVRTNYQLASAHADPKTGRFDSQAQGSLRAADAAWQRYLAANPLPPDDAVAGLMLQTYSELGLNQPDKAAQAAEIVANARPSANAYLLLEHYAALAHQDRKTDLAGQKAIDLAPPDQKDVVKQYVDQAKQAGPPAAPAPAPAPPPR